MTALQIIFYILSAVAISSAVMVVAAQNSIYSALCLVLTFFAMAGIWMLLQAEFLAIILLLVYVGAVMTLFLFVVMMLQVNVVSMRKGFVRYLPWGLLIVLFVAGFMITVVGPQDFGFMHVPALTLESADYSNTMELGKVLYTDYVYPFEIAAVLLLTAIVAAITLTHRKASGRKSQNIAKQIAVKREDRIRLVKMPSVRKE